MSSARGTPIRTPIRDMKKTRPTHYAEFKARAALKTIRAVKTAPQIGASNDLHSTQAARARRKSAPKTLVPKSGTSVTPRHAGTALRSGGNCRKVTRFRRVASGGNRARAVFATVSKPPSRPSSPFQCTISIRGPRSGMVHLLEGKTGGTARDGHPF